MAPTSSTPRFLGRQAVKAKFVDLARALGSLGAWVRMHYVLPVPARRRRDPVDGRRQDPAVPRHSVPARQPARAEAHEASGARREHARAHPPVARNLPDITLRSTFIVGFPARRKRTSQCCSTGCARRGSIASLLQILAGRGRCGQRATRPRAEEVKEERLGRFMEVAAAISAEKLAARSEDHARPRRSRRPEAGAIARSAADAPEIDGVVRIARPGKKLQRRLGRRPDHGADAYDLEAKIARA